MSARPSPKKRREFIHFSRITTRWKDNDAYRHINNVTYYSFFDTALNEFLIRGGLNIEHSPVIGLIAHSQCNYFSSLAFPDSIDVGLKANRLGNSSVTYALGIFREGDDRAAAQGEMVHVYVDRKTGQPVSIPQEMRMHLAKVKSEPRDDDV
ncbi:thioesterase family protein [Roseovarius sp. MMSF_3350]|uniref:acyl-CoA thioesterase n=1 Tax=Roseovarius sp. MMSF_3350 TaxID=3046706 RepID=UPI00273D21C7|nr:thioesterase family protein [Roseovarius sp. MMSF_3350]